MRFRKHVLAAVCGLVVLMACVVEPAAAQKQPNILVIMGDDVGWYNIGAYHQGIMAGKNAEPRHESWRLKGCASQTIMQKQAARPVARISLPGKYQSARA